VIVLVTRTGLFTEAVNILNSLPPSVRRPLPAPEHAMFAGSHTAATDGRLRVSEFHRVPGLIDRYGRAVYVQRW
jgi:hypothetical protein